MGDLFLDAFHDNCLSFCFSHLILPAINDDRVIRTLARDTGNLQKHWVLRLVVCPHSELAHEPRNHPLRLTQTVVAARNHVSLNQGERTRQLLIPLCALTRLNTNLKSQVGVFSTRVFQRLLTCPHLCFGLGLLY